MTRGSLPHRVWIATWKRRLAGIVGVALLIIPSLAGANSYAGRKRSITPPRFTGIKATLDTDSSPAVAGAIAVAIPGPEGSVLETSVLLRAFVDATRGALVGFTSDPSPGPWPEVPPRSPGEIAARFAQLGTAAIADSAPRMRVHEVLKVAWEARGGS